MNLQHANLNRLDVARRDLSDLKGRGPLVATAQGPRPFKSRRSLRATSNLYLVGSYVLVINCFPHAKITLAATSPYIYYTYYSSLSTCCFCRSSGIGDAVGGIANAHLHELNSQIVFWM